MAIAIQARKPPFTVVHVESASVQAHGSWLVHNKRLASGCFVRNVALLDLPWQAITAHPKARDRLGNGRQRVVVGIAGSGKCARTSCSVRMNFL